VLLSPPWRLPQFLAEPAPSKVPRYRLLGVGAAMAATGASHRCCCRCHGGSHSFWRSRRLRKCCGICCLVWEAAMAATGASHRCCCRRRGGSHSFWRSRRLRKCCGICCLVWELPWQRLQLAIGAAVAAMAAPTGSSGTGGFGSAAAFVAWCGSCDCSNWS